MKIANALLLLMLTVGIAQGAEGDAKPGYYVPFKFKEGVVYGKEIIAIELEKCKKAYLETLIEYRDSVIQSRDFALQQQQMLNDIIEAGCTSQEIYEALKDLSSWVEPSTGYGSMTLEYRTPASMLRQEADRIERRDATIMKAREVLERCGKYFKEK